MTSITLEQIISFLLDAPMFAGLDPHELSQIVHILQVQRVRPGVAIFREGDAGDAWYVIFDGEADVYKSSEFLPNQHILSLGQRACFGEMAMIDHSPRSATVIARTECTVLRFPRTDFEALLAKGNLAAYKLVHEIAKVLTARARTTTQRLSDALADRTEPGRLHQTSVSLVQGQSVSE